MTEYVILSRRPRIKHDKFFCTGDRYMCRRDVLHRLRNMRVLFDKVMRDRQCNGVSSLNKLGNDSHGSAQRG